jgi:hypothetical protein
MCLLWAPRVSWVSWVFVPAPWELSSSVACLSLAANQLFLWRDPKRSGAALAAATLLYVLFGLSSVSAVWLLSRALAVGIAATWIWAKSASFFGRQGACGEALELSSMLQSQVDFPPICLQDRASRAPCAC